MGVLTVLDAEGEPMRLAMRAEPDVVSPNELEAEELVGHEFADDEDRATRLHEIVDLGAREAIMTHARRLRRRWSATTATARALPRRARAARGAFDGRLGRRLPGRLRRRALQRPPAPRTACASASPAAPSPPSTSAPASSTRARSSGCWTRSRSRSCRQPSRPSAEQRRVSAAARGCRLATATVGAACVPRQAVDRDELVRLAPASSATSARALAEIGPVGAGVLASDGPSRSSDADLERTNSSSSVRRPRDRLRRRRELAANELRGRLAEPADVRLVLAEPILARLRARTARAGSMLRIRRRLALDRLRRAAPASCRVRCARRPGPPGSCSDRRQTAGSSKRSCAL